MFIPSQWIMCPALDLSPPFLTMKFDNILAEIGFFGKYQKVLGVLLYLCAIPLAEHAIAQVFLSAKTDHWCVVPAGQSLNCSSLGLDSTDCLELQKELSLPFTVDEDGNTVYSKCKRYLNAQSLGENVSNVTDGQDGWTNETTECDAGWEYDHSQYKTTVIQDFDLVCTKGDLSGIAQSVFFAGFLFGSLIWGAVADWAGRRPTFMVCVTLSLVSATTVSFMPNFASFTAMRFFVAAGNYGIYLMAFIIVSEIVGPDYRTQVGTWISMCFSLGYVLLSLLAYLLRNWRQLQLALSLPIAIYLTYFIFLPESPRWLISKKRYKEAKKVIDRMAEVNGTHVPENLLEDLEKLDNEKTTKSSLSQQPTHIDLFRTPNMRKKTINLLYNWFVNGFVYYGLSLSTSSLGIDPYIAAFVSGAVDFPAFLSSWYFMQRCGRRLSLCCYLCIAGLACLITASISPGVGRAAVAMFGKFGVAASFNVVYTFSVELYPTPIRTIGVGMSSVSARLSGILAPVILLLSKYWEPLPLVVFGSSAVVAGVLALLLPETLGHHLPETIEEGEAFGKGQGFHLKTPKKPCEPETSSCDTKYRKIPLNETTSSLEDGPTDV